MSDIKDLCCSFIDECRTTGLSYTMFNIGLHHNMIELVVAPEHDDEIYCSGMGCEANSVGDITLYLESVVKQIEWAKKKEMRE